MSMWKILRRALLMLLIIYIMSPSAFARTPISNRSPLTQDYTKGSGTLWQDFESVDDWTVQLNGTAENDTTNYKTGSQSIKLTVTTPGSSVLINRAFSPAIDLRDGSRQMSIWIYCHDAVPTDTINSVNVYCNDTLTTYWYGSILGGHLFHQGWNHIIITRNEWIQYGAGDWSVINRVKVKLNATSGQLPSISVDSLYYGLDQRDGRVVIGFDDGFESVYSVAYPIMSALGIRGTVWVIPTRIGSEGYMTEANLAELYNAGWAIANHAYTHRADPFLIGLTQEEVEAEFTQCQTWLDARGYTRASRHVAYPGGSYDSTVLAAMSASGMLTGRTIGVWRDDLPIDHIYELKPASIVSRGLVNAKSDIDLSVDYGKFIQFYTHTIAEGDCEPADFEALMLHGYQRRANFVTIDEFYEGLTNPRYRSQAVSRSAR